MSQGVQSPGRVQIEARTLRQDRWWPYPAVTFTIFPGTHATAGSCHLDSGTNWWRVRPLDQGSSGTSILGLYSAGQAFTWTAPVVPTAPDGTPFAPVSNTAMRRASTFSRRSSSAMEVDEVHC